MKKLEITWLGFVKNWWGTGEVFVTVDLFLPPGTYMTQVGFVYWAVKAAAFRVCCVWKAKGAALSSFGGDPGSFSICSTSFYCQIVDQMHYGSFDLLAVISSSARACLCLKCG